MNSIIVNSITCMMVGLIIAWAASWTGDKSLAEIRNSFQIKMCGVILILFQACVVRESLDNIFMSEDGFAYIVIEMVYVIEGFIAFFAVLDCMKMICFIEGAWVPESIKDKVVKIVWHDKHIVKKIICIEDAEIRVWLRKNLEKPLAEMLQLVCQEKKHYYKEFMDTYKSFLPKIRAIYCDLTEWEDMYHAVKQDDFESEKREYLRKAFFENAEVVLQEITKMKEAVARIEEMEKLYNKEDEAAFRKKVDNGVFKNINMSVLTEEKQEQSDGCSFLVQNNCIPEVKHVK